MCSFFHAAVLMPSGVVEAQNPKGSFAPSVHGILTLFAMAGCVFMHNISVMIEVYSSTIELVFDIKIEASIGENPTPILPCHE